ncbi:MAG: RimK/LysX family protein [Thermodesulfobacteriota bacterium]|nr:RimK/LysX family protein [Thermodesulfobacteriota bacterium]
MKIKAYVSKLVVFFLIFFIPSLVMPEAKLIIGRVEKVCVSPGNIVFRAKMDTGAKTSSLDCDAISVFDKDGVKWVRFTTINHKGKNVTLERKIHRISKIKRGSGIIQERIVVMLDLCLGNIKKETEVNLNDRADFIYRMLVGRSFMGGSIIVDPSLKYTTEPECRRTKGCE